MNRLFKAETGMTPVAYINSLRIEKAKMLIRCGSYTNDETAELCGFTDTKYFIPYSKNMRAVRRGSTVNYSFD